jgi:glycosidase
LAVIPALLCFLAVKVEKSGYVPDISKAVVYEANLRALGPSVGFDSLRSRLPAIKSYGTNVIWLMPVQPVGKLRSAGGLGSPYAPADFDAINPEFGDTKSFQLLVGEAHKLKMAVIIDWVADHTSWDCPWIKDHPDWYLHNAKGEITIPPGTGWNDVAALDYKNAAMRTAMITSMEGWITRFGIDGFRCDSSDRMPFDFWKTAIASLKATAHSKILMLAEGFKAEDYAEGFDLTYGWDFCSKLRQVFAGKPATGLAASSAYKARDIPKGARRLRFVTNHDISAWEGSMLELYKSREGMRTAFTITTLYGGTPLIYTGQEVDWDKRIPIFDHSAIEWYKSPEAGLWLGRLMRAYKSHPAFTNGDVKDLSTGDVVLFTRSSSSDEALVVANVRDHVQTVTIPSELTGRWADGLSGSAVNIGLKLELQPYGRMVLVRAYSGHSHP